MAAGALIRPHVFLVIWKAAHVRIFTKDQGGPGYLLQPGGPAPADGEGWGRLVNCLVFEWAPHQSNGWKP